jgi:Antibiotic biosynthesis monooxygenase
MTTPISFVVRLPGKPEHRETLQAKLHHVLETMAGEPDFINTFLHRSSDDPDTLVVYETWACSPGTWPNRTGRNTKPRCRRCSRPRAPSNGWTRSRNT